MKTVKITSKRQATFPLEVCEEMGVKAGDELELIPLLKDGERHLALRKHQGANREWIGSLKDYAKNVPDHSLEAIRESIARGRSKPS